MTLRHLNIFVTVCRFNSITKAAQHLYIAQPSVSVAIAEMEKHYNVVLFERINKRLVITDTGKQLYIQACQVLDGFKTLEETALKLNKSGKIRIGTSITIGKYMIPFAVAWIRDKFPDADVSVKINQTKEIELMILSGQLDIGFVEGQIYSDNLDVRPFARDRLIAVCGMQFKAPDKLKAEDFKTYPLILREKGSGSRDLLDSTLASRHISAQPFIESTSTQSIIQCAINNLGITVLPYSLVKSHLEANHLRQLQTEGMKLDRTYHVVMHKDKLLSPMQQQVLDMCCSFKNF